MNYSIIKQFQTTYLNTWMSTISFPRLFYWYSEIGVGDTPICMRQCRIPIYPSTHWLYFYFFPTPSCLNPSLLFPPSLFSLCLFLFSLFSCSPPSFPFFLLPHWNIRRIQGAPQGPLRRGALGMCLLYLYGDPVLI